MSEAKGALVTGAGSGIGRACALALDAMGYRVALVGRDLERLRATADACRDAVPLTADVRRREQVDAAIGEAVAQLGRLDVAVVNAGTFPPRLRIDETTDEAWRETLAINLDGAFHTIAAALPHLRATSGYVFGVGSVYGEGGMRLGAPYAASKSGMAALVYSVLQEWEEHGVRATLIDPGIVRTPMASGHPDEAALLEPEDVARAVRFCLELSPAAIVRQIAVERTVVARNDREVQENARRWHG
ncbi:MAG TPA: SDR family oxidoreductase [Conexibacter sp.]|nr:SDR family oxidoreductase [Conexibacter sp.]